MSFRRRHRWTRRFVLGLAFGVMATPALARPLESTSAELGVQSQEPPIVISYLSHGLTAADVTTPVVPDVVERAVAAQMRTVDPVTGIPLSAGIPQPGDAFIVDTGSTRPDDRADRFVVGDGTPAAPVSDGDGFALDWENGVTFGLGALAFVLALALVASYRQRPRIAL